MADLASVAIYNKLGKEYLEKIDDFFPIDIYDFMQILPKKGSVLDVGCAMGRDAQIFFKKGFDPTGIDLSDALLSIAKKRNNKIDFRKMDFSELEFPPESFDGVWANAVMQEIPEEQRYQTLVGFYRILKRTGKLHLMIKEGMGDEIKSDLRTGKHKRIIRYITKGEIMQLLKRVGFTILITENFSFDKGIKWLKVWAQK